MSGAFRAAINYMTPNPKLRGKPEPHSPVPFRCLFTPENTTENPIQINARREKVQTLYRKPKT